MKKILFRFVALVLVFAMAMSVASCRNGKKKNAEIINEDADISKILIEEMPAYFLGQKDLDSVIKIAENRIQKVLDERG